MRDLFPEYYTPTKEEFEKLWENCIFVLDTNVLLNLYRYSEGSREEFFQVLEHERIRKRLWLPYHVASEFQTRRVEVLISREVDQENLISKVKGAVDEGMDTLKSSLEKTVRENRRSLSKELPLNVEKLLNVLEENRRKLVKVVENSQIHTQNYQKNDEVRERIDKLFSGKVGSHYDKNGGLAQLCQDAHERYLKKVPPGYKDFDKAENKNVDKENSSNQYGDYIIWREALEKSKKEGKPLVFITDDVKDDWFSQSKGKRIGPRPELLREIIEKTDKFGYIYSFESFYSFAKAYLEQKVSEKALAEIEALERQREIKRRKMYDAAIEQAISSLNSNIARANLSAMLDDLRNSEESVPSVEAYKNLYLRLKRYDDGVIEEQQNRKRYTDKIRMKKLEELRREREREFNPQVLKRQKLERERDAREALNSINREASLNFGIDLESDEEEW